MLKFYVWLVVLGDVLFQISVPKLLYLEELSLKTTGVEKEIKTSKSSNHRITKLSNHKESVLKPKPPKHGDPENRELQLVSALTLVRINCRHCCGKV